MASLRPCNVPSDSRSLKMALSTGACWATHSILRCPSGARAGSLIMESLVMALLLHRRPISRRANLCTSDPVYRPEERGAASLAFCQYPDQFLGTIGHDPVGAEVEHAAHLAGFVYRPHVHPHAPVVGRLEKARGDHLHPPVLGGHLERVVGVTVQALQAQPAQDVEAADLPPGRRRRDAAAGDPPKSPHDLVTVRSDERPARGALYDLLNGLLHAGLGPLYLDVHRDVGELLVDLREPRHPEARATVRVGRTPVRAEAVAGVEGPDLLQRHLCDIACAVRGPVHGGIVDDDDLAIHGHVDVELQTTGPRLHRLAEGLLRVLGSPGRRAAVGDVHGPVFLDGPRPVPTAP